MNITNSPYIQSSQNIPGLQQVHTGKSVESVAPAASLRDTVSFSAEALRLSGADQAGTESTTKIRFDLVNRVKAEIAAGTYDTPDRMETAIERMASRIF